jgi:hypothetical protein
MFKRLFMLIAMATALVLAGCGSDVKLDQPAEGSSTAAPARAAGGARAGHRPELGHPGAGRRVGGGQGRPGGRGQGDLL